MRSSCACRSARSRRLIPRGPEGSAIEAQHLSRRLAHPAHDRDSSTGSSGRCWFFGAIGALLGLIGWRSRCRWSSPISHTHLVPRFPTAILVTG